MVLMASFTTAQADELEEFVDRVGMDYSRIVLPAAEPLLCQSECVSDDLCQAFTYVKPQVEAQEAICYLKDGVGTPQFSDCCTSGLRPDVTHALSDSITYQASQPALSALGNDPEASGPIFEEASASGLHDTLINYAKKCDTATGITVPAFNCANGVLIPEQGNTPATTRNTSFCNRPNVLNGMCDPGSRFQVLPGRTADAVAVALCRKRGLKITGERYNDIAVIQHNKKNGATCFYQALSYSKKTLVGVVPAPKLQGTAAWQSGGLGWYSPYKTRREGCPECHDSGAFIRSPYLVQLTKPPHVLPSTAEGYNNLNTPLKYVGFDFAKDRSWSIKLTTTNTLDNYCVSCHRLAVNNMNDVYASAVIFAVISTEAVQDSKNPHNTESPIWMPPSRTYFTSTYLESAKKYQQCAKNFHALNGLKLVKSPNLAQLSSPGCLFEPFARPW